MYLSHLLIDVGDNPDRPRPGRLWLRNLYRVHQRLAMAFPANGRKKTDREFLQPYRPEDFPEAKPATEVMQGQADVHAERSDKNGFLFRIDYGIEREDSARAPVILVQSAKRPYWDYAFGLKPGLRDPSTGKPVGNAGHLLGAPPETKVLQYDNPDAGSLRCRMWRLGPEDPDAPTRPPDTEARVRAGTDVRFRLNANPTRRLRNGPLAGKRVSVGRHPAAILDWLARKGGSGGFELFFEKDEDGWDRNWRIDTGLLHAWKKGSDAEEPTAKMTFACAMIDGILKITKPDVFGETLQTGIGPAKAFGFGLLSVAPAWESPESVRICEICG